MKDAALVHAVELAAFRGLRRAILRRPHADVRTFGRRIGRWGHRLAAGSRCTARLNLARVFPDLSGAETRSLARAAFEGFGAHTCEAVSLQRFDADEVLDLFDFEGWRYLEDLVAQDRGFFLHTGHFGCWEMALHPFGLLLPKFHAVARPADNPLLDAELRLQRERFGAQLMGKIGAAHRMLNAYRRGGRIAIIIDQHIRPIAAVRVPFLGRLAWTSPVLAMLSIRTGAPVVPFSCRPIAGGRYHLEIRRPIWPEDLPRDRRRAEVRLTTRILDEVAHDVRRHPELWHWMSRRWRDYLRGS